MKLTKKYFHAGRPKKPAVIQVKVSKHLLVELDKCMIENETYREILDKCIINEIGQRKGILK